MQRTRNHDRDVLATCKMTRTRNQRKDRSARGARSPRPERARTPRGRRCGLARLRSAYFGRAGELAARYSVTFERVIMHLWTLRRSNPRFILRHIAHVEDLVHAIACADGDGRAWADFAEQHERTLTRRCRDCKDELEATVQIRKFIAMMRRDALSHQSTLRNYAGTRPLRTWVGEAFQASRQRTRRAAFVLDPADSCCGTPLRFTRTGADG